MNGPEIVVFERTLLTDGLVMTAFAVIGLVKAAFLWLTSTVVVPCSLALLVYTIEVVS